MNLNTLFAYNRIPNKLVTIPVLDLCYFYTFILHVLLNILTLFKMNLLYMYIDMQNVSVMKVTF